MPFERFTRVGRAYKPKLSITRSGLIGLNNGSINRFKLKDYDYVVLYYDKEFDKIGVQPTNNKDEEGVCKLRHRNSGADVSARSFFDYYGIDYSETKRYDIDWDEENNMMVASLKEQ